MLNGIQARMILGLGNLSLTILLLANVGPANIPCHSDSLLWGERPEYYRMCQSGLESQFGGLLNFKYVMVILGVTWKGLVLLRELWPPRFGLWQWSEQPRGSQVFQLTQFVLQCSGCFPGTRKVCWSLRIIKGQRHIGVESGTSRVRHLGEQKY